MSKVSVTKDKKNEKLLSHPPLRLHNKVCAASSNRWHYCVTAGGWWGGSSTRWQWLAYGVCLV